MGGGGMGDLAHPSEPESAHLERLYVVFGVARRRRQSGCEAHPGDQPTETGKAQRAAGEPWETHT